MLSVSPPSALQPVVTATGSVSPTHPLTAVIVDGGCDAGDGDGDGDGEDEDDAGRLRPSTVVLPFLVLAVCWLPLPALGDTTVGQP